MDNAEVVKLVAEMQEKNHEKMDGIAKSLHSKIDTAIKTIPSQPCETVTATTKKIDEHVEAEKTAIGKAVDWVLRVAAVVAAALIISAWLGGK